MSKDLRLSTKDGGRDAVSLRKLAQRKLGLEARSQWTLNGNLKLTTEHKDESKRHKKRDKAENMEVKTQTSIRIPHRIPYIDP